MEKLFSAESNRKVDEFAINSLKIPGIVLMENASKNIFEEIKKIPEFEKVSRILILAGKGNNGGDGFALARHFIKTGLYVDIISLGDQTSLKGDALTNFIILKNIKSEKLGILHSDFDEINFQNYHLIIDALLGTGSKGELKSPIKELVEKSNEVSSLKVAIDLPTGLNPDTGFAELMFNSDYTITLCKDKPGLHILDGYKNAGKVIKVDIGFDDKIVPVETLTFKIESEDIKNILPRKKTDDNKYSAGKLGIIAGSSEMPGAGILTISASLKTGAGAVYGFVPGKLKNIYQNKADVAIIKKYGKKKTLFLTGDLLKERKDELDNLDVLAIGPGLGREEETQKTVINLLLQYHSKKLVLDADALFAIKNSLNNLDLTNAILTPHLGEFSNLAGINSINIKKNILETGRKFAQEHQCILVLKGAPTIIFFKDGRTYINSTGNPALAKFGSGDVLTGLIAGYALQTNLESAALSAVYLHGLTADILKRRFEEETVLASDLINYFYLALRNVRS